MLGPFRCVEWALRRKYVWMIGLATTLRSCLVFTVGRMFGSSASRIMRRLNFEVKAVAVLKLQPSLSSTCTDHKYLQRPGVRAAVALDEAGAHQLGTGRLRHV